MEKKYHTKTVECGTFSHFWLEIGLKTKKKVPQTLALKVTVPKSNKLLQTLTNFWHCNFFLGLKLFFQNFLGQKFAKFANFANFFAHFVFFPQTFEIHPQTSPEDILCPPPPRQKKLSRLPQIPQSCFPLTFPPQIPKQKKNTNKKNRLRLRVPYFLFWHRPFPWWGSFFSVGLKTTIYHQKKKIYYKPTCLQFTNDSIIHVVLYTIKKNYITNLPVYCLQTIQ